MADSTEALTARLEKLGFSEKVIKETLKNKKTTASLVNVLTEAELDDTPPSDFDTARTAQLATLSTLAKDGELKNRSYISRAIRDGRIRSQVQVEAAVKFAKGLQDADINDGDFDSACGVGVFFTPEELSVEIGIYMAKHQESIEGQRYKALATSLAAVKKTNLMWAPPLEVKNELERQFAKLLGPKDERDAPVPKSKAKAEKPKPAAGENTDRSPLDKDAMFREGWLAALHKPGGNPQIKPELRDQHLKATGGKVITRFPPEPNGFLHIGHSKAIAVNFGYARYNGGDCYLRYDDTNPEAEKDEYVAAIADTIEWLGYKPFKVTYSSDYFQELYDLAEELIKRDKAYVCHCTAEEVKAQRGGDVPEGKKGGGQRFACAHRSRPWKESLDEFRAMKDGKYKPKEAMLRMKQNIEDPNPQMWDLTAYRVLDAHHHRTGDKWKIYPTYDFTHCLCDSFENISHSLCTTEFILSRQSYDWLCDALEIYKPRQSEYGRLNINGTVLSKRKIMKLVDQGHVRDWDDPRLFTLAAVRRRGVPPGAILAFINELGVTTAQTSIQTARFDQAVRGYLEQTAPRLILILDPVKVVITNLPDNHLELVDFPYNPKDESKGSRKLPFGKVCYIDRSDFRETDSDDYFRLAPGKGVGFLKVSAQIVATGCTKDAAGKVTEIQAVYDDPKFPHDFKYEAPTGKKAKTKTFIHWLSEPPSSYSTKETVAGPISAKARIFRQLFKSELPDSVPGGFLSDLTEESEESHDSLVESGIWELIESCKKEVAAEEKREFGLEDVRFQALRTGYFTLDKKDTDLKEKKLIFNQIVSLKEDKGK